MTLATLKSDAEAGFNDADSLLNWLTKVAVPFLEVVVPQDKAEIQAVQDAANQVAPLISKLRDANDIDQPTHDALQARVQTVVSAQTPPAPVSTPVEDSATPAN